MKFIKSNSVNFSKYCNFDELSPERQESMRKAAEEITENARLHDEEARAKAENDRLANEASEEAKAASIRKDIEGIEPNSNIESKPEFNSPWLSQFEKEQEFKSAQSKLDTLNRNKAHEDRVNDLNSAKETLGITDDLNSQDLNEVALGETGKDVNAMWERGKFGDLVDEGVTTATKAGKGIASAFGSLLGKFDKTKNVGDKIKSKSDNVNADLVGMKGGNWADQHKIAAGAIGTGALLGAGALAYKAKKLMDDKKQLLANEYYAFDEGNICKETLIGGPYSTRKQAREDQPEAAHILKGSTLSAYGDFEVA